MFLGVEHISESTVDTSLRSSIIKIDVDLGVTQSTTSSITCNLQLNEYWIKYVVIFKFDKVSPKKCSYQFFKWSNLLTILLLTTIGGTLAIRSMAHWSLTCFSRPVTANLTLRGSDSEKVWPVSTNQKWVFFVSTNQKREFHVSNNQKSILPVWVTLSLELVMDIDNDLLAATCICGANLNNICFDTDMMLIFWN